MDKSEDNTPINAAKELLGSVTRVTLQLSNLCNYTHLHELCPTSVYTEKEILPAAVVWDVIDTLAECDFNRGKTVAWHVYNEPLLDPRLALFTKYARKHLSLIDILVFTNGWYLNDTLCGDLIDCGVTTFFLSAYTDADADRFRALQETYKDRVAIKIGRWHSLKPWILHGKPRETTKGAPCAAPLRDLTIRASGHIGMCCLDWKETWTAGNVKELGFARAMAENYEKITSLYAELKSGYRSQEFCRICPKHR